MSLVTLHMNYGIIAYSTVDVASPNKVRLAFNVYERYLHTFFRKDHISNFVTGMILETSAKVQLLTLVYKLLHDRHPYYIFPYSTLPHRFVEGTLLSHGIEHRRCFIFLR
jgi:hypothetical protein